MCKKIEQGKMKASLVNFSVAVLIKNGIIKREDEELYTFGINQLYAFVSNIVISIIIGIFFGMVWESIVFSVAYIPLRRYAGGYHAKTPGRCFYLSILLVILALIGIKYISINDVSIFVLLVVNIFIWIKAPVASKNKALNKNEQYTFKKRTLLFLLIENMILMGCMVMSFHDVFKCIMMTVIAVGIMLLLGIIHLPAIKKS